MSTQVSSAPICSLALLLVQTQVAIWKADAPKQVTDAHLYLDIAKSGYPLQGYSGGMGRDFIVFWYWSSFTISFWIIIDNSVYPVVCKMVLTFIYIISGYTVIAHYGILVMCVVYACTETVCYMVSYYLTEPICVEYQQWFTAACEDNATTLCLDTSTICPTLLSNYVNVRALFAINRLRIGGMYNYTRTHIHMFVMLYWWCLNDDIKWKHFPRHWPFVRGIHRSPVNSPHKGIWRGAFYVFFDLRLNKWLSKQSRGWWFESPSRSSLHYCSGMGGTVWQR